MAPSTASENSSGAKFPPHPTLPSSEETEPFTQATFTRNGNILATLLKAFAPAFQ
jgi:hypothetical protein